MAFNAKTSSLETPPFGRDDIELIERKTLHQGFFVWKSWNYATGFLKVVGASPCIAKCTTVAMR